MQRPLGVPQLPIVAGSRFTIAGIGVTIRGDGSSGGTIRVAGLVATGKPGTLQIRLVDPVGQGMREGLAPAPAIPAVRYLRTGTAAPSSSASSAGRPGRTAVAGCGGLTGVTPLTLYRDWILQTARQWGFAL